MRRAFLDIETTGLSPYSDDITVIGIYIEESNNDEVVQLIEDNIRVEKLIDALKDLSIVYSYNGKRFDLPFIKAKLKFDLESYIEHYDLMFHCWRCNLYGGLKEVERKLGIKRKLTEVDGFEAVRLWYEYKTQGNKKSLKTLLKYNQEDVVNLQILLDKLNEIENV